MRRRFFTEVGLGVLSLAIAVTTAIWPAWIEGIFGADPDHGSGALEWVIVTGLAAAAATLWAVARLEWKRVMAGEAVRP